MLRQPPHVAAYHGTAPLGTGGTAEVWSATGPRGPAALKLARTARDIPHLAAEAALLRRLSHPHVIGLQACGRGWLATDLVDGQPLDRYARRAPLADLVLLALELVDALEHLHSHGVVHGDLKPANVLVDGWGHLKLIDVGGTRRRGTPGFVAPEVLGGARPTEASDRYGLGATLYAAFTSHPPFDTSDPYALRHLPRATLPLPAVAHRGDLPAQLSLLVASLLARDQARRPSLAAVRRLLLAFPSIPPQPPMPGMLRVRRALCDAVAEAAAGQPVVVVLHGATGSGRRSLSREATRLARIEGMTYLRRATPEAFEAACAKGERPCTFVRLGLAGSVDFARQALDLRGGSLLIGYASLPIPTLARAGARHLSPDALTRDDARAIGRWLGVRDDALVGAVWRRSRGLPRALWIGLETSATRPITERAIFALPGNTARVVAALQQRGGRITLAQLSRAIDLPLPALADQIELLLATGRVAASPDGSTYELIGRGG